MNKLLLLTLTLPSWLSVAAQSTPGGVSGAEVWFQTEILNAEATWIDHSGDNAHLTINNIVGNNRPDLQYNQNGVHFNVEFDTNLRSSEKHQKVIPQNDPAAHNIFYKIEKDD